MIIIWFDEPRRSGSFNLYDKIRVTYYYKSQYAWARNADKLKHDNIGLLCLGIKSIIITHIALTSSREGWIIYNIFDWWSITRAHPPRDVHICTARNAYYIAHHKRRSRANDLWTFRLYRVTVVGRRRLKRTPRCCNVAAASRVYKYYIMCAYL